jgi:hypothetical protein
MTAVLGFLVLVAAIFGFVALVRGAGRIFFDDW